MGRLPGDILMIVVWMAVRWRLPLAPRRRLPSSLVATRLGRLAPLCFHQVVWRLPCSLELARQDRQVPH